MAKKITKRTAKRSSGKPVKKAAKKLAKKKAARAAPRAKAIKKLRAADLTKLKKLVAADDFESSQASDLDYALLEAVDAGVPTDYYKFANVREVPAMFWAMWWLEGEVNNGGFHQFFLNKGSQVAARALQFLKVRGPKDVARMLERAIKALPSGKLPPTYKAMMNVLVPDDLKEDERLMKAMDVITDKFFEREGRSLMEVRLRFVLEHSAEFFD